MTKALFVGIACTLVVASARAQDPQSVLNALIQREMQQADEVVDAEFKEVPALTENPPKTETEDPPPAITVSPPIVPTTENENSHDVEPQNRSESAQ